MVGQRRATCPCLPCILRQYQDCELKVFPPPVAHKIIWSKAARTKAAVRIQQRYRSLHNGRRRRKHFAKAKAATTIQPSLVPVVQPAPRAGKKRPVAHNELPSNHKKPRKAPKKKGGRKKALARGIEVQGVQNHAVSAVGGVSPRPPEDSEIHCGLCFGLFPDQCQRRRFLSMDPMQSL